MTEALKVFERIQKAAELNEPNKRKIESLAVGEGIRQGDVSLYLRQPLTKSEREKLKPWEGGYQLAIGSTRGSRHAICEGSKAALFAPLAQRGERSDLAGPIVEAPERFVVTHPDHAHFDMPAGTYETRYHRDLSTEKRMQD